MGRCSFLKGLKDSNKVIDYTWNKVSSLVEIGRGGMAILICT